MYYGLQLLWFSWFLSEQQTELIPLTFLIVALQTKFISFLSHKILQKCCFLSPVVWKKGLDIAFPWVTIHENDPQDIILITLGHSELEVQRNSQTILKGSVFFSSKDKVIIVWYSLCWCCYHSEGANMSYSFLCVFPGTSIRQGYMPSLLLVHD